MLKVREQFPYAPEAEPLETDCLRGTGCIGESMTMSFSVESEENISELEISAQTLNGAGGTIPAESIQLYVVHVWNQAGIGVYQSAATAVGELLLKDDRVSLSDKYRRRYKHWRHVFTPSYDYCAPNLRLEGPVRISLRQGHRKQLWVIIKPPVGCTAGVYEGQIKIRGEQKTDIKIIIELLPVELLSAAQDRLIWYRGKLDWRDSQHYVSEEIFRAQVRDIFEHGFTSISISESDRTLAQKAIALIEEAGFDRHLVFLPPFPGDPHTLKYKTVTPVAYLSDEIDVHLAFPQSKSEDQLAHHKINWQRASDWNMKSMASLVSQTFANRFFDAQDIGHAPNVLSYFLPQNRDFVHFNANLNDTRAKLSYYYWHAYMEKPNLHRVLTGVYLWKSGFDGISPYCYQHRPKYPFSPFDDFDEWEPEFHVGGVRKPFKDHMVTYPAANGSIPTIQWEAFRDGITDLRSLATLESALMRAESLGAKHRELIAFIRQRRDRFLTRIDLRNVKVTSETEPEPYSDIQPKEYQAFREDNLRDIVTIQQAMEEPL